MRSYLFVRPVAVVSCFLLLLLAACAPKIETGDRDRDIALGPTTAVPTATPQETESGDRDRDITIAPTIAAPTAGATHTVEAIEPTTQPTNVQNVPLPVREEITVNVMAQLGGTVNAVALAGNIVYAGIGPRLVTLDIGDPAAPRLLGQSEVLPGVVQAVAVGHEAAAGVAYLVAGRDLHIFDVSDPVAPARISTLSSLDDLEYGSWADIIATGDVVYAISHWINGDDFSFRRLMAFDVSNPAQPVVAAIRDLPGFAGVTVSGDVVYITYEGKLQLVDAANLDMTLGEIRLGDGDDYQVAVVGNLAYVVAGFGNPPAVDRSLLVLDVSNPARPEVIASHSDLPEIVREILSHVFEVTATDKALFLAQNTSLHDLCPPLLHAIDMTDASPRYAAEFDLGCIKDIAAAGDTMVAANSNKVQIFDASDPANVMLAGEFIYPADFSYMGAIALNDDVAYFISGHAGHPDQALLRMLDLTQPGAPRATGDALDLSSQYELGVSGLYARGDRLFVTVAAANFIAIDISRPANPRLIRPEDEGIYYVAVAPAEVGHALYAAVDGGLGIVDMSDPANPVLVNTISTVGSRLSGMSVTGRYLVFTGEERTTSSTWLQVYDVSDPLKPVEVGRLQLPGPVSVFAALGNTVYGANSYGDHHTLYLLDISNPAHPVAAGRFTLPYRVREMVAAGDIVYISGWSADGGILALNVSDRSEPYVAGRLPFSGTLNVEGDLLYVAAGDAGLIIASLPTSGACTNDSEFVRDMNVPDGTRFAPGAAFTKTWRLRNSGSCTWDTSYRLDFISGEQMNGSDSTSLGETVPPGGEVDISIELIAPQADGTYRGQWQLIAPDGTPFGANPYVEIVVP